MCNWLCYNGKQFLSEKVFFTEKFIFKNNAVTSFYVLVILWALRQGRSQFSFLMCPEGVFQPSLSQPPKNRFSSLFSLAIRFFVRLKLGQKINRSSLFGSFFPFLLLLGQWQQLLENDNDRLLAACCSPYSQSCTLSGVGGSCWCCPTASWRARHFWMLVWRLSIFWDWSQSCLEHGTSYIYKDYLLSGDDIESHSLPFDPYFFPSSFCLLFRHLERMRVLSRLVESIIIIIYIYIYIYPTVLMMDAYKCSTGLICLTSLKFFSRW